MRENTDNRKHK